MLNRVVHSLADSITYVLKWYHYYSMDAYFVRGEHNESLAIYMN